jgi:hypothetical protein
VVWLTLVEERPKRDEVFRESIAVKRDNHRTRRGGPKLTVMAGQQRGQSPVDAASVDGGRQAPVADDELWWVLRHECGTRSEEGPMAEDDDGRRWELTVRGLKR